MLLNVLVVWCGVHYRSHWGGVCVCVCVWKGGGVGVGKLFTYVYR